MSAVTYINGTPATAISVADRGYQYGDGLFETMLACGGAIPLWKYHYSRMQSGCQRLNITVPDEQAILQLLRPQIESAEHKIIKIIVTRGAGERGYRVTAPVQPNVSITVTQRQFKPKSCWEDGASVIRCKTQVAEQSALAGIKHLNRLEQVLASQEWGDDRQEGLMCTMNDHVIEATYHNLFAVKDAALFTPDLTYAGVAGVMRQYVIDLASDWQLPMYIQPIPFVQLADMDEVFLTNSIDGVWPITRIDQREFMIGPITRRIQDKVAELIPYQ